MIGTLLYSCLVTAFQQAGKGDEMRVGWALEAGAWVRVLLCPGSLYASPSLGCRLLICAVEPKHYLPARGWGHPGKLQPRWVHSLTLEHTVGAHLMVIPCSVLGKLGPAGPCAALTSLSLPSGPEFLDGIFKEIYKAFTSHLNQWVEVV